MNDIEEAALEGACKDLIYQCKEEFARVEAKFLGAIVHFEMDIDEDENGVIRSSWGVGVVRRCIPPWWDLVTYSAEDIWQNLRADRRWALEQKSASMPKPSQSTKERVARWADPVGRLRTTLEGWKSEGVVVRIAPVFEPEETQDRMANRVKIITPDEAQAIFLKTLSDLV